MASSEEAALACSRCTAVPGVGLGATWSGPAEDGDDAGEITLRDQNGSTVTLKADGIALRSAGDLTLEARGKVVLKGMTVDIQ